MQINHVEISSHPSQKSFLSQDKQQMLERIGEEAEAPSPTVVGMQLVQLPWKPGVKSFKKLRTDLQCDSATPPLGTLRIITIHLHNDT